MATQKVDLDNAWKLRQELKEIVNRHCKEIPYEGTEVDKDGIVDTFLEHLKQNHYSLLKHEK